MQFKGVKYEFSSIPWQYTGKGSWIFVTMPLDLAKEIRSMFKKEEEGWGRLKTTAQIGNSEWKTAVWFDQKANSYMLPLKAEIRMNEKVELNKPVKVTVWI